jgi:hypothetical protein
MNGTAVNMLIVGIAVVVHVGLALYSGRTSVNDGLGWEGPIYAAMVTDRDVQRGSAFHRLTPAFPLATALPFAISGNIVGSFVAVNALAFALLVFAACRILDGHTVPLMVKLCTALTLTVSGMFSAAAAFNPGQPDLLGVALVTLAVALCDQPGELRLAAVHIAATLGSPVGIVAPLYGQARRWHQRQRALRGLTVFVPALVVWALVQVWARGGLSGLLELTRFSRVAADVALWNELTFILLALYFLMTSVGGLTILLWSRPRWIVETVRKRPELLALVLPAALFIVTGGLDFPRMIAFLLPFWLILIGLWCRAQTASLLIPVLLAAALTLLTQHPWRTINDERYFVDWFPYSVHAGRVDVSDPDFGGTWRLRALIVVGGLAAFAAWRRRADMPVRSGELEV